MTFSGKLDGNFRLDVTAGWGHAGQKDVIMPGAGRVQQRSYTAEELTAIHKGAESLGLTPNQAVGQLGETTRDVYLNEVAYWQNVPANVWDFLIGGFQVIKKWLSYRERDLLYRSLTKEEAREVTGMVRRIAALLLLQPSLDANYQHVKAAAYSWPESRAREILRRGYPSLAEAPGALPLVAEGTPPARWAAKSRRRR